MTVAMTNPMNGILRLWKEKLLLRLIDNIFFLTESSASIVFSKGRKEDMKSWTRDFVHSNSASHVNSYAQKHVFNSNTEETSYFLQSQCDFSLLHFTLPNWSVGCSVSNEKPYSQW